jgi:hypothetical protein
MALMIGPSRSFGKYFVPQRTPTRLDPGRTDQTRDSAAPAPPIALGPGGGSLAGKLCSDI